MKGEIIMGWAKYAEDNFEIYLERMDAICNDSVRQQKTENETDFLKKQNEKNNSFSQITTGKSCFSLR